jgi:hypothetical protein
MIPFPKSCKFKAKAPGMKFNFHGSNFRSWSYLLLLLQLLLSPEINDINVNESMMVDGCTMVVVNKPKNFVNNDTVNGEETTNFQRPGDGDSEERSDAQSNSNENSSNTDSTTKSRLRRLLEGKQSSRGINTQNSGSSSSSPILISHNYDAAGDDSRLAYVPAKTTDISKHDIFVYHDGFPRYVGTKRGENYLPKATFAPEENLKAEAKVEVSSDSQELAQVTDRSASVVSGDFTLPIDDNILTAELGSSETAESQVFLTIDFVNDPEFSGMGLAVRN